MGNGWYDPLIQLAAYYNFTVSPGNTYDYAPFNDTIAHMMYNNMYGPGNCYDQTVDCNTRGIDEICTAADEFCYYEVEYLLDVYANRDEYDIRELQPDPFPYEFYVDYLNTPAVLEAIGAYVNFSESNTAVYNAFETTGDDDREDGTIEAVHKLVEQGIYVVHYAGDADYNCNWLGGQVISELVEAPGFSSAGYQNVSTADGVVHGQVKQSGKYAFVRVYESGHEVPFYQPLLALTMFERAIQGKDIADGQDDCVEGYKSVGTVESTYREGNGTIQTEVVSVDAIYDTVTNGPVNGTQPGEKKVKRGLEGERLEMRAEKRKERKRMFRPRRFAKREAASDLA